MAAVAPNRKQNKSLYYPTSKTILDGERILTQFDRKVTKQNKNIVVESSF
jgi:hypothetical protein